MDAEPASVQLLIGFIYTTICVVAVAKIGYAFGSPIGSVIKKLVGSPAAGSPANDGDDTERSVGAITALSLAVLAFFFEVIVAARNDERQGGSTWGFWKIEGLCLRACFDGVAMLLVLRGVIAIMVR